MDLKTLRERQQWTLAQKIDHSLGVIEAFASWFEGKVYVSFSGGKDSCVMLSLVELVLPQVPCVFIMTGCESPSVCRFVRQMMEHHNIEIIRPEKTLRQVFAEYGFPLVSKKVSHDIECVRRNPYCQSSRQKLIRSNPHCIPERWIRRLRFACLRHGRKRELHHPSWNAGKVIEGEIRRTIERTEIQGSLVGRVELQCIQ